MSDRQRGSVGIVGWLQRRLLAFYRADPVRVIVWGLAILAVVLLFKFAIPAVH